MLNRDNLRKLADYLASLPDNYDAFEMNVFFDAGVDSSDIESRYARHSGGVDKCGAVACAVGHGPSAGLLVPEDLMRSWGGVSWVRYIDRFFIDGYLNTSPSEPAWLAFRWMFDDSWTDFDNTPHGAAKRIYWLLEHGLEALPVDEFGGFDFNDKLLELYQ